MTSKFEFTGIVAGRQCRLKVVTETTAGTRSTPPAWAELYGCPPAIDVDFVEVKPEKPALPEAP